MCKRRYLLFGVLIFLGHQLALSVHSETTRFPSVLLRQEALSELLAEKAQLQAGDKVEIVQITNKIVDLNLQLHDLNAALTNATESLALARQLDASANGSLLAETLALNGIVQIHRNDYKAALAPLQEALELSRTLQYRRGEARAQLNLANAHFQLDQLDVAERAINESLPIWQEVQDKQGEALTLTTQGLIYTVQDKPAQATTSLKSAEAIWRQLNDPLELATTLLDLNFIAIRQGQWQNALSLLNEAQTLVADKQAEPYLAGQIAMSLGEVYEAYGQLQLALSYFRESQIHYEMGAHDVSASVDARNKVGRVLARLGNFDEAKQTIEEGLHLAEGLEARLLIGLCHEDLGRVYLGKELYLQARSEFLLALTYFDEGKRPWARTQSYLGQTEFLLGNLASANTSYEKALGVFKSLSDYTNEAAICFGMGKLALQQGQLDKAQDYLRRSIDLTEGLRENASSKDLRSSFLASVHDRYETYVELLMALHTKQPNQGFDIKAFEASEFGRARSLLDSLRNYQRELRQAADPALLLEEEKLQNEEQKLIDAKKAQFLSKRRSDEAIAGIDKQLTEVRSRQETLEARINSSGKFLELMRPKPLSYENIRDKVTDAETSLLEYSLGTRQSFAWVVTRDGITWKELPGKETITKAANKLIKLLSSPKTDVAHQSELQAAIEETSRLVIEPVSSNLQTPRLIVVPDGILQYVPFQILTASANVKDPLIAKFDIVNAPSASTLALMREQKKERHQAAKLLVGFGDPVFSSPEAQQTSERGAVQPSTLPRLFYSKAELRAIQDLTGDDSEFYIEHDATRQNFLNVDLSNFRIVHLVTHGVLNDSQPELSGLVLSLVDANKQPVDGYVGLADIYKLRAPVDLVVLSACHSALGPEVRGEGLIGMTRGFMYAGASSVIASLWQVDDESGAELMKRFYTNMLQGGMPPAAALRAAQNEIRQRSEWSSPYFWAAFTFQGDFDQRLIAKPITAGRRYENWIRIGVLAALAIGIAFVYLRYRYSISK